MTEEQARRFCARVRARDASARRARRRVALRGVAAVAVGGALAGPALPGGPRFATAAGLLALGAATLVAGGD